MTQENRNLILAMILSVAVLFAFDHFVAGPQRKIDAQRAQAAKVEQQVALTKPAVPQLDRGQVLAASPRVTIDAPEVDGSISLRGARLDDLHFKNYRERLEATSPEVTLLSPQDSPGSYFTFLGWTDASGAGGLPGPDTLWTQTSQGALTPQNPLALRYQAPDGLVFDRTITIDDHFMFSVKDVVTNPSGVSRTLYPYGAIRRAGIPKDAGKNAIVFEGLMGVFNEKLTDRKYHDLAKGDKNLELTGTTGWLGVSDHYWLTALVPASGAQFDAKLAARKADGANNFEASYIGASRTITPGATLTEETKIFSGAKRVDLLNSYKKQFNIASFEKAVDWGNFWFLTKPIFSLLTYFENLVANFGVAILMLTVVVKIIFYPLMNQSYVAMSRMRKLQPKMEEIKKKHGKDPQKMQQETMALYAKEKINPLAGCLPMLVPIPVFYALYKTLTVTIEMRHAPFFGWIKDLSARDPSNMFNLFGLLPFDPTGIPLIGGLLWIGILPLLYGFTMWLLQSMSPPPPDPIQRQVIGLMPFIFTIMFASFAAGLVIYWTWSNFLSIIQQYVIMRRNGVETEFDKWLRARRGQPAPASE
jgi:YidC/Oxa1 family membrane protein insertase